MNPTCRLPLSFDPAPLLTDLQHIDVTEWVRHFNAEYFEGDWEAVALRSIGGVADRIYPDPLATGDVRDTEILKRCPNISSALRLFQCDIRSARLLRLTPGSRIREHRDYNLAFDDGEVRLHIPIMTNQQVEFFLNGRRIEMAPGECWYLNFNLPHKVANNGDCDRIHLVVDCRLNDWLRSQLAAGKSSNASLEKLDIEHQGGWKEFRQFVLDHPGVQRVLRETDDRRAFVELVVGVAADHGFRVNSQELEEEIRSSRRNWFERWID